MKNIYVNAKKINGGCSEAMMERIEKKLGKIEKFLKEDEKLKITVEKNAKNEFRTNVFAVLADNYHIHCCSKGETFDEALSDTADDIEDVILRHNKKMKDRKKRKGFHDKRNTKNYVIEENEENTDVITKVKQFQAEEMNEEDAISRFEELGHDTFVFRNTSKSSNYCMLYRRGGEDGFGLIIFE